MAIKISGRHVFLEGDWTLSGIARNLHYLSFSLQQLDLTTEKNLLIDCSAVRSMDFSGMQILNVWLECVRIRGIVPAFINVPEYKGIL